MTWQGERFQGEIGFMEADSQASWRTAPRPPEGSPNVLMIVLDDVGFGHLGCYGSPIDTPNIDKLAAHGLRYNNFHTTAMCSPTRSCLLTGRNHHTHGLGMISELSQGFPRLRWGDPALAGVSLGGSARAGVCQLRPG